eukprot:TRINITY_DN1863_c0_g2_i1.p1 TRINITY_DN1863_c0_g2~~TRINITY_DN1863_c0_g2_i1.p1  ORF type:complete len:421 (+),score=70.46 TRINITY_DN1863_c0_g2_i1:914-2176(+)
MFKTSAAQLFRSLNQRGNLAFYHYRKFHTTSHSIPKMKLKELTAVLKSLAPLHLAESWDNVGLLVEPTDSATREVERVFLTNDLTEPVLQESIEKGAQYIVAYHPPIFSPFKSLNTSSAKSRIILKAVENRIAIYSPHTAFDSVQGGINDWIAHGIKSTEKDLVTPLQPHTALPPNATHKLFVFVPASHVDELRKALSEAGAGVIGEYSHCTFAIPGQGSFWGSDNTNPAVGSKGALEKVDEIKLETVCNLSILPNVLQAIRKVHPYETPAFDIASLTAVPDPKTGQGRLLTLADKVPLSEMILRIKKRFNLEKVRVALPYSSDCKEFNVDTFLVKKVALCAGAGYTVVKGVSADLYLTGEMRHHEVLDCTSTNKAVILCDHSNTERGYLHEFKRKLLEATNNKITVEVSELDHDPLVVF